MRLEERGISPYKNLTGPTLSAGSEEVLMQSRTLRAGIAAGAVLCVLLIGTAVLRREGRPAATIADLKVNPTYYLGKAYSNTLSGESGFITLRVASKDGSNFQGTVLGQPATGQVSSKGKVTAKSTLAGGDFILKGQLSAERARFSLAVIANPRRSSGCGDLSRRLSGSPRVRLNPNSVQGGGRRTVSKSRNCPDRWPSPIPVPIAKLLNLRLHEGDRRGSGKATLAMTP